VNAQAATLRHAVVPRSDLLTDALLVLAGTGLVAGAAQISFKLPFTPVPITGQTFAVVKTLEYGLYPFVPGDVFKLYVAAGLLPGAWRLVERTSKR
jgi:biotin transport system substrate-specific component